MQKFTKSKGTKSLKIADVKALKLATFKHYYLVACRLIKAEMV